MTPSFPTRRSFPTRTTLAASLLAALVLVGCNTAPSVNAPTAPTNTPGSFDRPAALALAAQARDICAEHMPDARATRDALTAAGLPRATLAGGLWLHTTDPTKMIVALNGPRRAPLCAIAVRQMTAGEARALIQPWLDEANAVPEFVSLSVAIPRWRGQFKGGPVRLVINDEFSIPGVIRGRAIIAGVP